MDSIILHNYGFCNVDRRAAIKYNQRIVANFEFSKRGENQKTCKETKIWD